MFEYLRGMHICSPQYLVLLCIAPARFHMQPLLYAITFCCLTGGLLAICNRDDVPVAFALEAYAPAEFSTFACIINVHAAIDLYLRVYHTRSFSNLSNVSIDNVMCACGCVRVFMWQEQTWAPSRGLQFALGVLPSLAVLSPRPPSLARYTYENDSLSLLTL